MLSGEMGPRNKHLGRSPSPTVVILQVNSLFGFLGSQVTQ